MREYLIWLFKLLTIIVIFIVVIPTLIATVGVIVGGDLQDTVGDKNNQVAVLELNGVIMDTKDLIKDLHKQVEDDNIKGIVLRIDSPGGAVGPSQDVFSAVNELKKRKPIIASMGAVAASGGLYAALAASKVYAQPGTITGSIGVILQIPNFRKIADTVGFEMMTVKSGKFKDVGNSFRDMTDDERALLQSTVTTAYDEFVQAVADGRGISKQKVAEFADGRIILGSQALELKLIDAHGGVYDAARAVFDILGKPLPEGQYPKLVYPGGPFGKFSEALKGASNIFRHFSQHAQLSYIMN